ncbi:hypothetical protein SLEP1_g52755 [Rubroshorea leprosula]|uniref:Uncharacterized protein n=1 Tax=Rubroshorea leprosula TaxID=152421 RepID=A0AAV5MAP4_9ROSI|nr:hypothetical protein SLEP1_g52755 [Rubroshorea leprosula]
MGHHKHSFVGFLLLLLWSCLNSIGLDLVEGRCWGIERGALLAFKEGLTDDSNRLSSWIGQDCCKWAGVGCDNQTSHVIILNLRNPYAESDDPLILQIHSLGGTITPSLQYLKHLSYLDMSHNDFGGIQIPNFFGMLHNLEYLNLSFASFGGQIPPSLGNLSSLQYLDVAQFEEDIHVRDLHWLAGLSSLRHLNLGGVNLNATGERWIQAINKFPSLLELYLSGCQLAHLPLTLPFLNFTSLLTIDMSANNFNSTLPNWLYNLTKLQHLNLHLNAFNGVGLIHKQPGNLCNLQILDLSYNKFHGEIKYLLGDFQGCSNTSLMWLQLSYNKFVGSLPNSLSELKNLQYFDVSNNSLAGSLPNSLATLRYLQHLDLSSNSFSGSIPESIGNLSSLRMLDLSDNIMNGTIPESFGQLLELVQVRLNFPLDPLSTFHLDPTFKPWFGAHFTYSPYNGFEPNHYKYNLWNGVFTEAHLINLTSLENIILTVAFPSSLVFNVSYDWVPPFMLKEIHIENCLMSKFPAWLKSQSKLTYVLLRNAGISDTIPETWFSRISTRIERLNLSKNKIKGRLPRTLASQNLHFIDLSSNLFEGPIPFWSTEVDTLYLHDNLLSGPIPGNIDELMPELMELDISWNRLQGTIPSSLCKIKGLEILSLGSNRLSGELPNCWNQSQRINVLDVANNSISGKIPRSICFLTSLQFLLLSKNNFHGKIPACLQNCSSLWSLDVGGNRLSGELPSLIGENLSILRAGSNSLTGKIPPELCIMKCVHILDLSNNSFSGVIPNCVNNLTTLVTRDPCPFFSNNNIFSQFSEHATVITKGTKLDYGGKNLEYVNNIDLSRNNLTGRIPEEITTIPALTILNLSMNHLNGSIPNKIGNLRWLESLDLSHNQLSGQIPQSLSNLTSLSYLNLSYNNLTGKIPSGNQLETLNDPSIYEGNHLLCGFPLPGKCPGDSTSIGSLPPNKNHDDDDYRDYDKIWLAVSIITGFLVGFWGVCGSLALKKSWRHVFFGYVNQMNEKILLWIALKVARSKRRLEEPSN